MHHTIIIGRGPAGMTSAIYLGRANKDIVLIGKKNEIWRSDVIINNYFGVGEIDGKTLMERGEEQVKSFDVKIVDDYVVEIKNSLSHFVVKTGRKSFEAKNLLLAVGSPLRKKEISNEEDYIGRGVSYCVPCDGFFFRNKKVIIVGNTSYTLTEAEQLLNYTKDVAIFTNGKEPEFKQTAIPINKARITKIVGKDKVEAVETENGRIKADGVFIASGNAGASELAMMIGVTIDKDNKIITDKSMRTNVKYVWAAGDCTPGPQQIGTAVGESIAATFDILRNGRR